MVSSLSTSELYPWLLNRCAGDQAVFAAEIDGVAAPDNWHAAFAALQRRHPLLRLRIGATPSSSPRVEAVHCRPIPLREANDAIWTNDRIASSWLDAALVRELCEPVGADAAPMMRAVVASGETRSILILTCNYGVCDGIGLSYCVRDLLRALAGEPLGELRMPPSLEQMLCEAQTPTPALHVACEEEGSARRDLPVVSRLKLSRDLTGRIARRAREEGTTVHGAVCSALVKAGLAAKPRWRNRPVTIVSPVDLRQRLGIVDECGSFTGRALAILDPAFFLKTARAMLDPGFDGSFWHIARETMYAMNVPRVREVAWDVTRGKAQLRRNGPDVRPATQTYRSAVRGDITLMNLGTLRFPSRAGRFRLTGLWGPGVPIVPADDPGMQVVGLSTVDGRAHMMLTSLAPVPLLLENAHALLEQACA